jgi:hypothetical protein
MLDLNSKFVSERSGKGHAKNALLPFFFCGKE